MLFTLIGTFKCSKLSSDFYVLSILSSLTSWGKKPQTPGQMFMSKKPCLARLGGGGGGKHYQEGKYTV